MPDARASLSGTRTGAHHPGVLLSDVPVKNPDKSVDLPCPEPPTHGNPQRLPCRTPTLLVAGAAQLRFAGTEAHMEPTTHVPMLSPACDSSPRRLTIDEEARIARALAPYPPVYPRRRKLAAVPDHKPTPRQPWQVAEAA